MRLRLSALWSMLLLTVAVPASAAAPSLVPATVGASVIYGEHIVVTTPKGTTQISGSVRLTRASESAATIALSTTSGQSATIPATIDGDKLEADRSAVDPTDSSKKQAYALFAPFGQLAGIMKAHSGQETTWSAQLPSDPMNPYAGTMAMSANLGMSSGDIAINAMGTGPGRITLPDNSAKEIAKGAAGGAMLGATMTGHPGLGAAIGAHRARKKSEGVEESVPTTNSLRLKATIAERKLTTINSSLTQHFVASGRDVSIVTTWNVTPQ